MDPNRVYVENVRAFLGVNTRVAAWLCEEAWRDGLWEKWYAFEHPKLGHIVYECPAASEIDLTKVVRDDVAEALEEPGEYHLSDLKRVNFYRKVG